MFFNKSVQTSIEPISSRNNFVTKSDLEAVTKLYEQGGARLEAADKLANNIDNIAREAYDACIQKYPYLNNDGEANSTQVFKENIEYYLRLIQYSLVVGGTGPLDEWSLAGGHEVYRNLDLPNTLYVAALQFIREHANNLKMSAKALLEFQTFLDYAIASLS